MNSSSVEDISLRTDFHGCIDSAQSACPWKLPRPFFPVEAGPLLDLFCEEEASLGLHGVPPTDFGKVFDALCATAEASAPLYTAQRETPPIPELPRTKRSSPTPGGQGTPPPKLDELSEPELESLLALDPNDLESGEFLMPSEAGENAQPRRRRRRLSSRRRRIAGGRRVSGRTSRRRSHRARVQREECPSTASHEILEAAPAAVEAEEATAASQRPKRRRRQGSSRPNAGRYSKSSGDFAILLQAAAVLAAVVMIALVGLTAA